MEFFFSFLKKYEKIFAMAHITNYILVPRKSGIKSIIKANTYRKQNKEEPLGQQNSNAKILTEKHQIKVNKFELFLKNYLELSEPRKSFQLLIQK